MRCPTLSELPPPPSGKTGWPWTEESPQLPNLMPDGSAWTRISIVTPNYNYGNFIEETIRSVLLQGYPNLEYIVIDGGSTDNSVEIIKKYENWLSYWISEKDSGQSNAINKGIEKSTGTVFNWLNSDDSLNQNSLILVSKFFVEDEFDILIGRCEIIQLDENSKILARYPDRIPSNSITYWDFIERSSFIDQPSVFMKAEMLKYLGSLREDIHYVMDYALYIKIFTQANCRPKVTATEKTLSFAKLHPSTKTMALWNLFEIEMIKVLEEVVSLLPKNEIKRLSSVLNQLEIQTRVRSANYSLINLVALPTKKPSALLSRFYWGAVRRSKIQLFRDIF